MAQEGGQERTEEATPKRLREAREKGQVARSRELTSFVMMMATGGALLFLGGSLVTAVMQIMSKNFQFMNGPWKDPALLPQVFLDAVSAALWALAPILILLMILALIVPALLGGWIFSAEAIQFKWERIDPIKGLVKLFSARSVAELLKSIFKFVLISAVVGIWLWIDRDGLLARVDQSIDDSIVASGKLLVWALLIASAPLLLVVLPDAFFQMWDHARQLKMTRQEVRDENKETEGNPEVRGRIRSIQREMARRRMMADVPRADVIITNPTHYAIALKYDQEKVKAPVLLAKGADLIAFQIRNTGSSCNVPVISAPALARAIYFSTALKAEVPSGLYVAVAQVLAYVYQVKRKDRKPAGAPPNFDDLPIPEGMRRD